jgi:uncharacterized membrane protein
MTLLIISPFSSTLPLMKTTSLIYLIILVAVVIWCSLILLAPLASSHGYPQTSQFLYTVFGRICHQLDSHSLRLGGEKLGVCARCSAIYFGFLLGVIAYPMIRFISNTLVSHRRWILLAGIPMCVDVFLAAAGIHQTTVLTRLCTGSIFGFLIAFTIVPGLSQALSSFLSSQRRHHAYKT